jgi:hypothetical protein
VITTHCVACNNTENLHNHHLTPRSRGGDNKETNLITLCGGCHGKVHGKDGMWLNHKAQTKKGLQDTKARGVTLGNPVNLDKARLKANAANRANATEFADHVLPTVLQFRGKGDTLPTIAGKLNSMGVKTRRGGSWYASTVANILKRAEQ